MDSARATLLIEDLRRLSDDETDGRLLERYRAGEGDAFARLVRRHGAMVLGVCRRVLRHEHDAEDAFQATFLTLARKAGSVRRGEAVASWLHGTALRLAWKARGRRRRSLPATAEPVATEPMPDWERDELSHVLDEEIGRLPEWCRVPFVLCHLEGRSCGEVARQLGCPRGTVLSRLARARQRLAERLRARGITSPGMAVPVVPTALGQTAAAIGSRVLTGEVMTNVVSAGAADLALCGGKMSKLICCILLGLVTTCGATTRGEENRPCLAAASAPPVAAKKEAVEPPSRLEVVLREWEKANAAVKTATYRFQRTLRDRTFGTTEVTPGVVQLCKPGWLRVEHQGKEYADIWLYTPESFHLYQSSTKEERVVRRPGMRPYLDRATITTWKTFFARLLDGLLYDCYWIYAGLPPRDLARHLDLRIYKEDSHYVYLEATPRTATLKREIHRAGIVLLRDEFRIRQLWWEHSDGSTTTLDYLKFDPKAKVTPESIREGLPRGWKRVEVEWPPRDPDKAIEKPMEKGTKKGR